jgi:hypothetical protein
MRCFLPKYYRLQFLGSTHPAIADKKKTKVELREHNYLNWIKS